MKNLNQTQSQKQDITMHSDSELSDIVFNTEVWYTFRRYPRMFRASLKECFIYTPEQLEVLEADLKADEEEN